MRANTYIFPRCSTLIPLKGMLFIFSVTAFLWSPICSAVKFTGQVAIKNSAGLTDPLDIESVVIYLVSTKLKKNYKPPKFIPKIFQKDKAFIPLVLPVLKGTTVEFDNLDPYMHNVFSVSETKSFDLGLYKLGDKGKQVTFEKSGVVSIYCNIHEQMMSFILVLENPYFTTVDKSGKYTLDLGALPSGEYKLVAWYRFFGQKVVDVKINSKEQSNVDFEFIKNENIDKDKLKLITN